MADTESARLSAAAAANLKSLELLFDYTKFHIGLYLTLAASYITIATVKVGDNLLLQLNQFCLWLAMLFFGIAGLSGGVIASSITQCVGQEGCRNSADFLAQSIGPWNWRSVFFPATIWTYVEHTSFWLGLICAALSFVGARKQIRSSDSSD